MSSEFPQNPQQYPQDYQQQHAQQYPPDYPQQYQQQPQYPPYQLPDQPTPPGHRLWWVVGGAVAAVAAVAVIAGLIISDSGARHHASAGTASATASGRVFTRMAAPCSLIKPATIAAIAPKATCSEAGPGTAQPSASDFEEPGWSTGDSNLDVIQIHTIVNLTSDATEWYQNSISSFLDVYGKQDTLRDSRSLTGMGDQAYIGYVTDKTLAVTGMAEVDVRWGNVAVTVDYNYSRDWTGHTETQQEAENAAIAATRDILAGLS